MKTTLVAVLMSSVTSRECYKASGYILPESSSGQVPMILNLCWPKSSKDGAIGVGVG